ncbi:MAG: HAD family phosphatase [Nanoarchaeota archaeon]|nr:HAD family phosphatase [Nanoarchaeota archaeon]
MTDSITNSISAVIFDQGNVLDSHKESDCSIAEALGFSFEEFQMYAQPHVRALHLGMDELEYLNQILHDAGKNPTATRIFRQIYESKRPFNEQMLSINTRLRDLGYKTGIISNAEIPLRDLLAEKYTVSPTLFDAVVCSCDVGYAKPDKEIYSIGCTQLEIKPEQGVFIDDNMKNVDAFEQLGGKGIHHTENKKTIQELSDVLGYQLC